MQADNVIYEKSDGERGFGGFCPNCEASLHGPFCCKKCGLTSSLIYKEMKYCYSCGQALTWIQNDEGNKSLLIPDIQGDAKNHKPYDHLFDMCFDDFDEKYWENEKHVVV